MSRNLLEQQNETDKGLSPASQIKMNNLPAASNAMASKLRQRIREEISQCREHGPWTDAALGGRSKTRMLTATVANITADVTITDLGDAWDESRQDVRVCLEDIRDGETDALLAEWSIIGMYDDWLQLITEQSVKTLSELIGCRVAFEGEFARRGGNKLMLWGNIKQVTYVCRLKSSGYEANKSK